MDYISFDELLMIQKTQEACEPLSPAYLLHPLCAPHQIPQLIRQAAYEKKKNRPLDREEEEELKNACPCYDCNKRKTE